MPSSDHLLRYLCIYDIRHPKRLRRVAKIMEKFAIRVQYSVFEFEGNTTLMNLMRELLQEVIDHEEDSLMFFPLCEKDWQKRVGIGCKNFLPMKPPRHEIW